MRLAFALGLLLAVQTSAGECVRSGERCRGARNGRPGGAHDFAEFAPASTYFGQSVGTLPTCTGDSSCVMICKVTSGGSSWNCYTNTGADAGVVTQGTGTTYQDTFGPGLKAMSDVTSAKAPRVVSTSLDALFKADHTIVMGGYATTLTDPTYQHWIGANDGSSRIFYVRNESGSLLCVWSGAGGTRSASSTVAVNGWTVASCRQSGTDHYARNNGADGPLVSGAAITANLTAATPYYMGDRETAGLPMRGPLAFVAFYSEAKSDTQLRGIENSFWGVGLDAGLGLSGVVGLPNDAGTRVDFFAALAHAVSPDRGLRTVGQTENVDNNWAADPFAVESWTNVGTPLVGVNVASGPFAAWKNTAECDNLEDNDGAAFEGKASGELQRSIQTLAQHAWTIRVWASKGDAGTTRDKMRLALVSADGIFLSDGGLEEDCDFTLDDTVKPYDCKGFTTDAGVATVKGRVLVGNTAATQGSITVCHAQDTPRPYAQLAVTNSTAFGSGNFQLDTTGWPSTSLKGKYEIVFTPLNNVSGSDWDNANGLIYLFDANVAASSAHAVVIIPGYSVAGHMLMRSTQGANSTEFDVTGISTTAGQRYAVSMEWRPVGGGRCNLWARFNSCSGNAASCAASTVVASSTDGTGYCPDQPTVVRLGDRYDQTVPSSVFIDAVRVYR